MLISTSHVGKAKSWNKEIYAAWSSVTMSCYSTWSSTIRACLWDMLTIQRTGTTVLSSEIFQEIKPESVFILNLLSLLCKEQACKVAARPKENVTVKPLIAASSWLWLWTVLVVLPSGATRSPKSLQSLMWSFNELQAKYFKWRTGEDVS